MTAAPLEAIDGGRAPSGWEGLWACDRWPLRELPHADLLSTGRRRSDPVRQDRAAVAEGGSQAVGTRPAAGRRSAEHDGSLCASRGGVQRLAGRPGA